MRTYGRDTRRIDAKIGERFALELLASATAGFTWVLKPRCDVVRLVQEKIRAGSDKIGAKSVQRFELVAERAGSSTLVLEYERSSQDGARERLEIEVSVEP